MLDSLSRLQYVHCHKLHTKSCIWNCSKLHRMGYLSNHPEFFYGNGFNSILAWINDYNLHQVWDDNIHPLPNYKGEIAVLEWISNVLPFLGLWLLILPGIKLFLVDQIDPKNHGYCNFVLFPRQIYLVDTMLRLRNANLLMVHWTILLVQHKRTSTPHWWSVWVTILYNKPSDREAFVCFSMSWSQCIYS